MEKDIPDAFVRLPEDPVDAVINPLKRFLHIESASGILLLLTTLVALILANSPLSERYLAFWKTPLEFKMGSFHMSHSLQHWINDGLMTIFFFVIGLEVKRELVIGELRDFRQAALPIASAIGGMVVPATIYFLLQYGAPGERGWGVMAGSGFLAGIGFTMAIFIAGLALDGALLNAAKVGILAGSVLSAIAGVSMLIFFLPKNPKDRRTDETI